VRNDVGPFLESGQGLSGKVGLARSYLFDAAEFVRFGVRWIEREFGVESQGDVDQ
jgi:hypothetical protein